MTGQSDAAAERSAGEPAREGAEWPVVEVAPGVWRSRAIVDLEAENERLRRIIDGVWPQMQQTLAERAAEIERLRALVAAQEATR